MIISEAASSDRRDTVLLAVDLYRAYACAKATRHRVVGGRWWMHIQLTVRRLTKSLCGTRDAVHIWERELGGCWREDWLA